LTEMKETKGDKKLEAREKHLTESPFTQEENLKKTRGWELRERKAKKAEANRKAYLIAKAKKRIKPVTEAQAQATKEDREAKDEIWNETPRRQKWLKTRKIPWSTWSEEFQRDFRRASPIWDARIDKERRETLEYQRAAEAKALEVRTEIIIRQIRRGDPRPATREYTEDQINAYWGALRNQRGSEYGRYKFWFDRDNQLPKDQFPNDDPCRFYPGPTTAQLEWLREEREKKIFRKPFPGTRSGLPDASQAWVTGPPWVIERSTDPGSGHYRIEIPW
jgi:hypothetical protein